MATGAPSYDNYDQSGEIGLLSQQLGPLGGILSSLGMNPDQMLLNSLLGNQFGGQQARLGGRSPRLHDIMVYEQQKTFFDLNKIFC